MLQRMHRANEESRVQEHHGWRLGARAPMVLASVQELRAAASPYDRRSERETLLIFTVHDYQIIMTRMDRDPCICTVRVAAVGSHIFLPEATT